MISSRFCPYFPYQFVACGTKLAPKSENPLSQKNKKSSNSLEFKDFLELVM